MIVDTRTSDERIDEIQTSDYNRLREMFERVDRFVTVRSVERLLEKTASLQAESELELLRTEAPRRSKNESDQRIDEIVARFMLYRRIERKH